MMRCSADNLFARFLCCIKCLSTKGHNFHNQLGNLHKSLLGQLYLEQKSYVKQHETSSRGSQEFFHHKDPYRQNIEVNNGHNSATIDVTEKNTNMQTRIHFSCTCRKNKFLRPQHESFCCFTYAEELFLYKNQKGLQLSSGEFCTDSISQVQ